MKRIISSISAAESANGRLMHANALYIDYFIGITSASDAGRVIDDATGIVKAVVRHENVLSHKLCMAVNEICRTSKECDDSQSEDIRHDTVLDELTGVTRSTAFVQKASSELLISGQIALDSVILDNGVAKSSDVAKKCLELVDSYADLAGVTSTKLCRALDIMCNGCCDSAPYDCECQLP